MVLAHKRGLGLWKKDPLPCKRDKKGCILGRSTKRPWLVWSLVSLWILRTHPMSRVRDVEIVWEVWEAYVWSFQHGACKRELTRGKRKPCRVAWMDQFIGMLGSAMVGYLPRRLWGPHGLILSWVIKEGEKGCQRGKGNGVANKHVMEGINQRVGSLQIWIWNPGLNEIKEHV